MSAYKIWRPSKANQSTRKMVSFRSFFVFTTLLISCRGQRLVSVTPRVGLADGLFWDARTSVLYFVDNPGGRVMRYDPLTGTTSGISLPTAEGVSFVIPTRARLDQFVVALGKDMSLLTWDGSDGAQPVLENITSVQEQNVLLNDGKSDVVGRVWTGTLGVNMELLQITRSGGALYSLDTNSNELETKLSPVTLSNGLTWSLNNTIFYYIDSATRAVSAFDYDASTGTISNRREVFSFVDNQVSGSPDSMTIDAEDNLWIACYGGSKVIQVNPTTGEMLQEIKIPVQQVTSVAFGGPNMEVMYVSTGRRNLNEHELKDQPLAGSVFRVEGVNATGVPPYTAVREV